MTYKINLEKTQNQITNIINKMANQAQHRGIVLVSTNISEQEKIMPEVEKIKASLPKTLSPEENWVKIIESKYPSIVENRKYYELAPIYDVIIKTLEGICTKSA